MWIAVLIVAIPYAAMFIDMFLGHRELVRLRAEADRERQRRRVDK